MTLSWRGLCVCLAWILGSGCISTVPYTPDQGVVDEVGVAAAHLTLERTLSRAVEPRVLVVETHPEYFRLYYPRTALGPWYRVSTSEQQFQLQYFNLGRVVIYANHKVFLYDLNNRELFDITFASRRDCRTFADLVMSFKARLDR